MDLRILARFDIIEDGREKRDDAIVSKLQSLCLYKTDREDRYDSHKIIAMTHAVPCFIILWQSGAPCRELNLIFLSRVI